MSKGCFAPKNGKIVNHGGMNDFRTMICCFALLVGWRGGMEVWRGGMEVWRGGMVYPLKEWKIAPDLRK